MAHPALQALIDIRARNHRAKITNRQMYYLLEANRSDLLSSDEQLIARRLGDPDAKLNANQISRLRELGHINLLTQNEVLAHRKNNPAQPFTEPELVRLGPNKLIDALNDKDPHVRDGTRLALAKLLAPGGSDPKYFTKLTDKLYDSAWAEGLNAVFRERNARRQEGLEKAANESSARGFFLSLGRDLGITAITDYAEAESQRQASEGERTYIQKKLAAELERRGASKEDLIRTFTVAYNTMFNREIAATPPNPDGKQDAIVALGNPLDPKRPAPTVMMKDGKPILDEDGNPLPFDTEAKLTAENMVKYGPDWILKKLNYPKEDVRARARRELTEFALKSDAELEKTAKLIYALAEQERGRMVEDRMKKIVAGVEEAAANPEFVAAIKSSKVLDGIKGTIEGLSKQSQWEQDAGSWQQIASTMKALRSALTDTRIENKDGKMQFGTNFPRYAEVMAEREKAKAAADPKFGIPAVSDFSGINRYRDAATGKVDYDRLEALVLNDTKNYPDPLNSSNILDRMYTSLDKYGIKLSAKARADYMESFLLNSTGTILTHLRAASGVGDTIDAKGKTIPGSIQQFHDHVAALQKKSPQQPSNEGFITYTTPTGETSSGIAGNIGRNVGLNRRNTLFQAFIWNENLTKEAASHIGQKVGSSIKRTANNTVDGVVKTVSDTSQSVIDTVTSTAQTVGDKISGTYTSVASLWRSSEPTAVAAAPPANPTATPVAQSTKTESPARAAPVIQTTNTPPSASAPASSISVSAKDRTTTVQKILPSAKDGSVQDASILPHQAPPAQPDAAPLKIASTSRALPGIDKDSPAGKALQVMEKLSPRTEGLPEIAPNAAVLAGQRGDHYRWAVLNAIAQDPRGKNIRFDKLGDDEQISKIIKEFGGNLRAITAHATGTKDEATNNDRIKTVLRNTAQLHKTGVYDRPTLGAMINGHPKRQPSSEVASTSPPSQ